MATKQELLKKVLGEIKTKVADDIIVDFSKESSHIQTLASWGSLLVDQIAPLCRSKLYEIYGKYSCGKTSLAISASATSSTASTSSISSASSISSTSSTF